MKKLNISFYSDDPKWSQLSNGGGTRTILKSAQALRELGHKVSIVAHKDNFTWEKHQKPIHKVPANTDILIAVTISDVKHIMKYKGMRLAYYSRPVECDTKGHKWQMSQKKALATLRKFKKHNGTVISNSGWQVDWLAKHGIKSNLVYSGIDLDFWNDTGGSHKYIGGLINKRHKTKRSDIVKKYATVHLKNNLNAYGVRELYNKCSIWLAPTEKEGFHNVPAEACMCGNLIVCNRLKRNGMGDYATDETAMRYDTEDELLECIENPDFNKVSLMQELIREKIGSREKNMKRMVRLLK